MLKLKKLLIGFMVAAIAVTGFMSCSSDGGGDSEPTVRIKVSADNTIIAPDEKATLTASVENAVFSIESGSEYATIEGSVVTGVKAGEVVVKATADGYLSGTVKITVTNVAIVLAEDSPDGTDSPLFLTRVSRTVRVVPSTATLEISSGATYFDTPVNNGDGTWTVSVRSSLSSSRNFYFATLTATSGENTTDKHVAVLRGYNALIQGTYWGKSTAGKSLYAGVPYYQDSVDGVTTYNYYITYAADGVTESLQWYPYTSWDVGEDGNSLICYGYESEEKLKSGEYSVSVAQYYQGSTRVADFTANNEKISAYQLINGSSYANEYEGDYYSKYLETDTTYTSTLKSGSSTLPVIVDLKSGSVNFTSSTYYGSYYYNVWTKSSSGWTVNAYSSVSYIRAGRPCATIDIGNKTISVNVANQMGEFNDEATSGYAAYTPTANVPVSFSGTLEEPSAMLSCWVTAMGGQEFGHAVLKGYKITQNADGTLSCTLSTGSGVGVIFGIGFVAFIDPTANGSEDSAVVEAALPKYYDASGNLQPAEYTVSETDFGALPSTSGTPKQVAVVDSITFPVTRDQSEYNLWMYINSNIMGVQFCDGKGSSSSNHPGEATPYVGKFTIDWDKVTVE